MIILGILVYTAVTAGACTLYVYECAKHPDAAKFIASLNPYYMVQKTLCSGQETLEESESDK